MSALWAMLVMPGRMPAFVPVDAVDAVEAVDGAGTWLGRKLGSALVKADAWPGKAGVSFARFIICLEERKEALSTG